LRFHPSTDLPVVFLIDHLPGPLIAGQQGALPDRMGQSGGVGCITASVFVSSSGARRQVRDGFYG
jgi:hypothetical protein